MDHFKPAFRNILKHRSYTVVNIVGLAIGLATCILIVLFVRDELSYDQFNKNANRIYRINTNARVNGADFKDRLTPAPLGLAMKQDFPAIENMVRLKYQGNVMINCGNQIYNESNCYWADSTLFQVFTLPLIEGDSRTALASPNCIVISESVAKKYFKGNALGGTLLLDNNDPYTVTGIFKEMPSESHIHPRFIKAMSGLTESRSGYWLENDFDTYLLVHHDVTKVELEKYLQDEEHKYVSPQLRMRLRISAEDAKNSGNRFWYTPIALTQIHLYSDIPKEIEPTGAKDLIYLLMAAALIILAVASVNFTNLYIAYSSGRTIEVGVRKILGSYRLSLIIQFLTESVATSLISLFLAVAGAILLLPYFNQIANKTFITEQLIEPRALLTEVVAAVVTGLIAGLYPALRLSSFKAIDALKGKTAKGFKRPYFKNSLVVFQMVIAILLITGTLVIYQQMNFVRHKRLGYDREHVLIIRNCSALENHDQSFKNQVLHISGVTSVSFTDAVPTSEVFDMEAFSKDPTVSVAQTSLLGDWRADEDFIPVMKMKIVQGRNFRKDMPSDSNALIISQTASRILGFSHPLNKILYRKSQKLDLKAYHVIGVVQDFNTGSLAHTVTPIVMQLSDSHPLMIIRFGDVDISGLLKGLKSIYSKWTGGMPFLYTFLDTDFDNLYRTEVRAEVLFGYFAFFAILIASMGLFALVYLTAREQTKEIGIRKILGASVSSIVALLSKEFLRLIIIATVLAIPLAWWGSQKWLDRFAYHTNVHWYVYGGSALLAASIALLTVCSQAVKAAVARPIKSLRTE